MPDVILVYLHAVYESAPQVNTYPDPIAIAVVIINWWWEDILVERLRDYPVYDNVRVRMLGKLLNKRFISTCS